MEQSGILLWKQAYASHHTHFCDQDEQCGGAQCGAIAATIATAEVGTVEQLHHLACTAIKQGCKYGEILVQRQHYLTICTDVVTNYPIHARYLNGCKHLQHSHRQTHPDHFPPITRRIDSPRLQMVAPKEEV